MPAADSGDALGLPPSRLTVTFGFGAGLFSKDGNDRYGLGSRRPDALVDMPAFNGDQLVEAHTGGDLSIQACADDPQVAFHAVRQLARLAYGVAQLRWTQAGFIAGYAADTTPRNLMGFKDGTINPKPPFDRCVGSATTGPAWMRDGSYLVTRRIRISLEHWDRTELDFQEEVIGRHKYSGAPLGKQNEFDPLDLAAMDQDGNPVIAENAHVRLAAPEANDGAEILRRAYSYNDGRQLHRRTLAAVAAGPDVRRRSVLRRLSARPAHWFHPYLRHDVKAGCVEPVHDACRQRLVRLPRRRARRRIHRPAVV